MKKQKATQKKLGVTPDGVFGPVTAKAIQKEFDRAAAARTDATPVGAATKDTTTDVSRGTKASELANLKADLAKLQKDNPFIAKNFGKGKRAIIQLGGDAAKYDEMRQLTDQIAELEAEPANMEESIINESTYSRWQKLIKG